MKKRKYIYVCPDCGREYIVYDTHKTVLYCKCGYTGKPAIK